MQSVSSKSDEMDTVLAGVEEKETSVDSVCVADGGEEGADEMSESVYALDDERYEFERCEVEVAPRYADA